MQTIKDFLPYLEAFAIALSIFGGIVFPALSRIAKLFGDGPKATAASKLFDGLGLDVGKASRAVRSLKDAAPTVDELARKANTVPPDEDTDAFIRRGDK